MVWYSHLFQNFPQFIVIHTVKGFGIVNKAEIDVFWEFFCLFHDPADVGNLIGNPKYEKKIYFQYIKETEGYPYPLVSFYVLKVDLFFFFFVFRVSYNIFLSSVKD